MAWALQCCVRCGALERSTHWFDQHSYTWRYRLVETRPAEQTGVA